MFYNPWTRTRFSKNIFFLLVVDALLVAISYLGSYYLRFDLEFSHSQYLPDFKNTLISFILLKIFIFFFFGLYQGMWPYTCVKDLENLVKTSSISSFFIILFISNSTKVLELDWALVFIDWILTICLIRMSRVGLKSLSISIYIRQKIKMHNERYKKDATPEKVGLFGNNVEIEKKLIRTSYWPD